MLLLIATIPTRSPLLAVAARPGLHLHPLLAAFVAMAAVFARRADVFRHRRVDLSSDEGTRWLHSRCPVILWPRHDHINR